MVFNSLDYLLFLPVLVIIYYILPYKLRNSFLLLGSYVFYASYNAALLIYLIAFTGVTYVIGRKIASSEAAKQKGLLILGITAQALTLIIYKYTKFLLGIVSKDIAGLDLLVPLGISFITFSGISYLVDVYREKISAERRILHFALYMAFFPKIVQGPIVKYGDIVSQFDELHDWDKKNFRAGAIQVLYGLFMKMVIADRLAVAVNTVYASPASYAGATLLLATMLFSLQIYFDFAGYSLTALGSARLLGFVFADNFRQPYLSSSVSEFWKRWHISLNKWLTDYIYIPLGGSRCSAFHRDVNTLVTFGISGLWHGADWGFVIWGLLNGVYIVIEKRIHTIIRRFSKNEENAEENAVPTKKQASVFGQAVTFILISFSWIFFRAQDFKVCQTIVTRIFTKFNFSGFLQYMLDRFAKEEPSYLGLTAYSWTILIGCLIFGWLIDMAAQKWNLVEKFPDFCCALRWALYLALIFVIILFGMYGYGYSASAFIYAQF